jgi:hypothetical protein
LQVSDFITFPQACHTAIACAKLSGVPTFPTCGSDVALSFVASRGARVERGCLRRLARLSFAANDTSLQRAALATFGFARVWD